MKRNLKALGLALVAAFAMSVVAATAAQAEGPANFTQPDEEYPVVVTGHEEGDATKNFFQITGENGPKTHCASVTYEGTAAADSNSLTVTPHYTSCEVTSGGFEVNSTVDLNGCHYNFIVETKTATGGTGSAEIVCPPGNEIEVTTSLCDTRVPEQKTAPGTITYTNVPDGDVTVEARIDEELTYTEDETSIFGPCDDHAEDTHDGSFVSDVLVTGFEDLGTHASEGTPGTNTYTEGNPLDIDVG